MDFKNLTYIKKEIDNAGRILAYPSPPIDKLDEAKQYINDWRSAHYYPISTLQMTLRNYAYGMDQSSIVVQRLKKMQSIRSKLIRYPTMKLHRMQDIGGCRAIMSDVGLVFNLTKALKSSRQKHILSNEKDYISNPKDSGYRGIHLIYKYVSTSESRSAFNGMHVEIQIRTYLQHIWATAVETAGAFTNNALKSSQGNKDWLRFFVVVSSIFSLEENCTVAPNTSFKLFELKDELKALNEKNQFILQLETFNSTIELLNTTKQNLNNYYVLFLKGGVTQILQYQKKDIEEASAKYLELEKTEDNSSNNVVLVSASSIENLRKAYPNYFLDTRDFCLMLKKYI